MKRFCFVTMAILCFVPSVNAQVLRAQVGQVVLPAQSLGNQPAAVKPPSETIVYPVRSGPASDLAQSLTAIFENARIIAVAESNVLLIHVASDSREEILGTLTQLDRQKRVIEVQAYLLRSHGAPLTPDETAGFSGSRDDVLKRIEALRKSDQLSIENRIELTTLENQKALVQFGQQLPILTGITMTATRMRANNYQQTQTGTILSVTARTTQGDAIELEINFEKSEVDPQAAPSDEDATPLPPSISRMTYQTTLQFANGEAALAGTMVGKPATGPAHSYLVVIANVRDEATTRAAVASGPASGLNPIPASNPAAAPRSPRVGPPERATRPPAGASSQGSAERFPGPDRFPGSSERYEQFLRLSFDRADGDGDGVLSEEEQAAVAGGRYRDQFNKHDKVSFDVYKSIMAAHLPGVGRARETVAEPQPGRSGVRQPANDPRLLFYYEKLLEKYDSNSDGKLNADEWSKMNKDPAAADVDGDGLITVKELVDWGTKR